jgi:diguanylate cyclase
MHYSIQVNDTTILDLRHIPVILVAFYGGYIPAFIAAFMISIGRFMIAVNFSSIVSLFMIILVALGASGIAHFIKLTPWKKWILLLTYSQLIYLLALYIVVENFNDVVGFAFNHVISTFIGGGFVFYFVLYIRRNSELYNHYKENSERDPMTGLFNVRSFDHHYNVMISNTILNKGHCAVCLVDIDHFKKINDTYGHPAGDEVLKKVAKQLSYLTREGDIVSRNGGEEFSILLPNTGVEEAGDIAERIRRTIEFLDFPLPNKSSINLTVSIGIAANDEPIIKPDLLFQEADDALYLAKQSGRNNVYTLSTRVRTGEVRKRAISLR